MKTGKDLNIQEFPKMSEPIVMENQFHYFLLVTDN